jgi:hypothetical protein
MTNKHVDTPDIRNNTITLSNEELRRMISSYYDDWSEEGQKRFLADLQSQTSDDGEIPF